MNNKIKQRFINYWNSRSGVDYSKIPFTVEMLANGNLQWSLPSSKQITSLKYQVNDDTPVDVAITSGSQNISISNLVAGDKVKFKGVANKYVSQDYQSAAITATSDFIVYGNIMSLFYDENFYDKTEYPTTTAYCLNGLFRASTHLIDASNLILSALTLYERTYREMFMDCTSLINAPKNLYATTLGRQSCNDMFKNCRALITAPKLPATTLAFECYFAIFYGCTKLTTPPPELPATTVKQDAYREMFNGCTSLTTAPALPATTVGPGAYREMFSGCSSLTTAPELPATTISGQEAYRGMFQKCTSLTSGPSILPAVNNFGNKYMCYAEMFSGCSSLTIAPELPLTNVGNGMYDNMFKGCSSLTTAPALPATTLANKCYYNMFNGCTSLTTAPALPATTLASDCYSAMFYGCTSLTTAPALPATTLASDCYSAMFYGCKSLTTAPELPATTLTNKCYYSMFRDCTNLNYIKCLATSKESNSTDWWTNNVANAGTFDCLYPPIITKGIGGIPTGWTYNYMNTTEMLHFVNKGSSNATIGWYTNNIPKTIKYSKDNENWTSISSTGDIATLAPNEVLYVKATNSSYEYTGSLVGSHFTMTGGEISVEGNIMSLIDEDNFSSLDTLTAQAALGHMFYNCTSLKYADKLQLLPTTLTDYCYHHMFADCTSLTTAPALPATTLAQNCYYSMFNGCTSLTAAPELPATTLADYCYHLMFHDCTSLTTAPELPATTLADKCYYQMFSHCTSLTTAHALPATILAQNCYEEMFKGCTSLTTAPELPATTLASNCYYAMFSGCTSLTAAPVLPATVLTAYCYYNMFSGCSNVNKIYMLATDISATNCLVDWLKNTASTGTVYYDTNSITLPIDSDSGIPVGWTGIDIYSLPENKYFTLEALEDGTITYKSAVGLCPTYSKNNEEWERSEGNLINIKVKAGDVIRFKQIKDRLSTAEADYNNTRISSTGQYKVYGNIMSLLYGDSFYSKTTFPNPSAKNYCFRGLFKNSTTLIDISNLIIPLTETADFMMAAMFENCSSITTPCKLPPVKTLSNRYEYQAMFYNCTALTTNPDLIATTGSPQCYERMFNGCTSLSSKPIIKLNTVSNYSCAEMFNGCSNINYVEIWTTYNTYSFASWLNNTAASGYIVYLTSNYIEKPSGWKFINMIYSNNDTDYYASKDYAAHVLGYESPQDAIDAGYTLQTVTNTDNNWDYYLYSAA